MLRDDYVWWSVVIVYLLKKIDGCGVVYVGVVSVMCY